MTKSLYACMCVSESKVKKPITVDCYSKTFKVWELSVHRLPRMENLNPASDD